MIGLDNDWHAPDGTCWYYWPPWAEWTGWMPGQPGRWQVSPPEFHGAYPDGPWVERPWAVPEGVADGVSLVELREDTAGWYWRAWACDPPPLGEGFTVVRGEWFADVAPGGAPVLTFVVRKVRRAERPLPELAHG